MIAYLEGDVISNQDPLIIKTKQGVGYAIYLATQDYDQFVLGSAYKGFIYCHVKEDEMTLYAFDQLSARELFITLISVSGVGPKLALMLMRSRSQEQIKAAISQQNLDVFSGIKGLGKKTIAKLVLMLQDKIEPVINVDLGSNQAFDSDAKMALIKLGYQEQKVIEVLKRMSPCDTAQTIRQALAELSE
jgi:Holliday junction DNA helicase RuvA|tara:strand:+ start:4823 stop:5389 length:567 start_codon:yes stop_codon:yes gene_type:complete